MDGTPLETDYYRRREAAQRALAARAKDPQVARIHLDLADLYAARWQNTPHSN